MVGKRGLGLLGFLAAAIGGIGSVVALAGPASAQQKVIGVPHDWQMGLAQSYTPVMERAASLHNLLLVIITLISLFVLGLLIYVMWRFHASRNPVATTVTHNTALEIAWTIIPILILVVIAIPSFRLLYFGDKAVDAAMTIKVTGRQWYWSYEYPDQGNFQVDSRILSEADRAKPTAGAAQALADSLQKQLDAIGELAKKADGVNDKAAKLGFAKVTQLKGAVAEGIRDFVGRGGFLFAMCSATDTYDIALASHGLDIADVIYDGDPPDPSAPSRLDFSRTFAFRDFHVEMDPIAYRFSDIDVTQDANKRGPETVFTLFDFSAKNDPVPTMLTQDHVNAVPEFLGATTGYHRARLKTNVTVLGEVEGTDEVKYLHGEFGRGTFTFLGGHDPEDFQHMVGDPETHLDEVPHSPGYRLILDNVLFPAAEKKKQKT